MDDCTKTDDLFKIGKAKHPPFSFCQLCHDVSGEIKDGESCWCKIFDKFHVCMAGERAGSEIGEGTAAE